MYYDLIVQKSTDIDKIRNHITQQLQMKRQQLLRLYSLYNIQLEIGEPILTIRQLDIQQKVDKLCKLAVNDYLSRHDTMPMYSGQQLSVEEINGFCTIALKSLVNDLTLSKITVHFSNFISEYMEGYINTVSFNNPKTYNLTHPNKRDMIDEFKKQGIVKVGIYRMIIDIEEITNQIKFLVRLHTFKRNEEQNGTRIKI